MINNTETKPETTKQLDLATRDDINNVLDPTPGFASCPYVSIQQRKWSTAPSRYCICYAFRPCYTGWYYEIVFLFPILVSNNGSGLQRHLGGRKLRHAGSLESRRQAAASFYTGKYT